MIKLIKVIVLMVIFCSSACAVKEFKRITVWNSNNIDVRLNKTNKTLDISGSDGKVFSLLLEEIYEVAGDPIKIDYLFISENDSSIWIVSSRCEEFIRDKTSYGSQDKYHLIGVFDSESGRLVKKYKTGWATTPIYLREKIYLIESESEKNIRKISLFSSYGKLFTIQFKEIELTSYSVSGRKSIYKFTTEEDRYVSFLTAWVDHDGTKRFILYEHELGSNRDCGSIYIPVLDEISRDKIEIFRFSIKDFESD